MNNSHILKSNSEDILNQIEKCVNNQKQWRGQETINMIASENQMSPTASSLMCNDFEYRYAEGLIGKRAYQGQQYHDEMESITLELAKKLFKGDFVDLRLPTATIGNLAIFYSICKPQDDYFSLDLSAGAHISFRKYGGAGCRNLNIHNIPYNSDNFNIDIDLLTDQLLSIKPKLITLGGSVFLFPHPVKEIAKVCEETNTLIHYDGSHVLGLIAGGQFQDPLREGADILLGSTHKSFPGPQGALIIGNEKAKENNKKLFKKIQLKIFPGLVSNHHLWRFPPLAVTLLEMIKNGPTYAQKVIKNAQALAQYLYKNGFNVQAKHLGFTKSHQVLLKVSEFGGGAIVANKLEEINIICNKNTLPNETDQNALKNPSGIRIGTRELTRFGFNEKDMKIIAEFYKRALIDEENVERLKSEVLELRKQHSEIQFTEI